MSSKKASPAPAKTTAASPAKGTSAPAPAKTASAPAKGTSAPAQVKPVSGTAVPVPETVLKKRKVQEERRADALKKAQELRKKRRVTRGVIFQRAEKYASKYRRIEQSLRKQKQLAKSHGNFFVEPEAKVALVIRIRGINGLAPKPRKVLQLLRLRQINNAAFVRINAATKQLLTLVEPYVTYGYPNLKTVRELVYKRGFAKVDGERLPISSNAIIEQNLGRLDIICIEDIIHEIYTCGPNFKSVNKFLWPFKLHPPRGGWKTVLNHVVEGGDFGNREEFINQLVKRMN